MENRKYMPENENRRWSDGWGSEAKFVLTELKRLNDVQISINCKLNKIGLDILRLQMKSGLWGLLAGAIPVGILLLVKYL